VFCQFICLGEIPDGSLRAVVASASQNPATGVLIQKLIRPLPHIANKIHDAERASAFGMRGNGIGTAHGAALVRVGDGGSIPLISPRIEAAISSRSGVLPFPFARQTLSGPGGVGARIFEGTPPTKRSSSSMERLFLRLLVSSGNSRIKRFNPKRHSGGSHLSSLNRSLVFVP
jgi:hypothetical protein